MKDASLKLTSLLLFVTALSACTSEPKREEGKMPRKVEADGSNIDYIGLQRSLGLERQAEDLGYKEKTFDTCAAGYGYSSTHDCQKLRFATVNIRLQCRDSEGTISTGLAASDLQAIAGRQVRWALSGKDGSTQTDGEGYAQIAGIFPASPKTQRLRIAVGNQFLYMRAHEITRVVVPRPWCE